MEQNGTIYIVRTPYMDIRGALGLSLPKNVTILYQN